MFSEVYFDISKKLIEKEFVGSLTKILLPNVSGVTEYVLGVTTSNGTIGTTHKAIGIVPIEGVVISSEVFPLATISPLLFLFHLCFKMLSIQLFNSLL